MPMSDKEEIHIALASDQGFYCGLRVTASSMAQYASKDVTLCFHVLDGGIKDEAFAEFRQGLSELHPSVRVIRHCVDEDSFKDCPQYAGSRLTYARLLLPTLLPDVRHVLYCDCDFLWRADVAELWKEKDDSIILQSARDGFAETERREGEWFARNGYEFCAEKYFCAGLSFYNLELFREEGIAAKAFEFLNRHQDVNCADQSAMNAILYGRVRLLPRKWQTFTCLLTHADLKEPVVLHYADELPWKRLGRRLLTDPVMLWHRYNDTLLGTKGGSLALYFSLPEIIIKRTLDRLLQLAAFKECFYFVLRRTGRGSYCGEFDTWSRNLGIGKIR